MSDIPPSADVVICGAGMTGICTAYFLTKMGIRDILLVDRRSPLTLTSDKSAETYCNWWPDETMFRFAQRSLEIMEELARQTGNAFNLNRRGECYIATSLQKATEFQHMAQQFAHLGLGPVRVHHGDNGDRRPYVPSAATGFTGVPAGSDLLLDQGSIREHFPYVSPKATAVLHARSCGWFSAHTLGMLLLEQAKKNGVREVRANVEGVEQDKAGVCAVRVRGQDGTDRIHTRCFVNAAGPFVKQVAAMLGVELPVRTGLWEKFVFKDHLGVIPRSAPTLILKDELFLEWSEEEKAILTQEDDSRWLLNKFASGPYLRPEGGQDSQWVLMGWAYNEPPYKVHRRRDEKRVGAGVVCEPQWDPRYTRDFPEIVLRGMASLIEGLKQYLHKMPRPMQDGGYYVQTKDVVGETFREENPPLIGPLGPQGAFIVNVCHGVSMGCAAGELCAAWLTGNRLPEYAGELSLQRYYDTR
ncbi:MAG: FAD-dependent oxidoreductase [Anaerolineae bacterium]